MADSRMPEEGHSSESVVDVQLQPPHAHGFAAIVSLRGDHDLATAPELTAALAGIAGSVLVDLAECTFIDSTVIGVLFTANHELERSGHYLELVVPRENVKIARTLELVRMRDVIVVHEERPSLEGDISQGA